MYKILSDDANEYDNDDAPDPLRLSALSRSIVHDNHPSNLSPDSCSFQSFHSTVLQTFKTFHTIVFHAFIAVRSPFACPALGEGLTGGKRNHRQAALSLYILVHEFSFV